MVEIRAHFPEAPVINRFTNPTRMTKAPSKTALGNPRFTRKLPPIIAIMEAILLAPKMEINWEAKKHTIKKPDRVFISSCIMGMVSPNLRILPTVLP